MAARRSMSPNMRRPKDAAIYTSFIQASVVGGFVLQPASWCWAARRADPDEAFDGMGLAGAVPAVDCCCWRYRCGCGCKLSESPVFQAMKEEGETVGQSLCRKLHLSRQQASASSSRCSAIAARPDDDLVHRDVLRPELPARGRCMSRILTAELIVGCRGLLRHGVLSRTSASCQTGSGAKSRSSSGYAADAGCCCSRCSG